MVPGGIVLSRSLFAVQRAVAPSCFWLLHSAVPPWNMTQDMPRRAHRQKLYEAFACGECELGAMRWVPMLPCKPTKQATARAMQNWHGYATGSVELLHELFLLDSQVWLIMFATLRPLLPGLYTLGHFLGKQIPGVSMTLKK